MPMVDQQLQKRSWLYTRRLAAMKALQQLRDDLSVGKKQGTQAVGPGGHKLPTDQSAA